MSSSLSLLDLARRLRSPAQAERLEQLLVERAVSAHRPRRAGRAGPPQRPGRPERAGRGIRPAADGHAGRRAGRARMGGGLRGHALRCRARAVRARPAWRLNTPEPELTRILRSLPGHPAGIPRPARPRAAAAGGQGVRGPGRRSCQRATTWLQYPGLAEERLLVSVDQGRMEPLHAYDRIVDIRIAAQQSPYVDAALLGRLWPSGLPAARRSPTCSASWPTRLIRMSATGSCGRSRPRPRRERERGLADPGPGPYQPLAAADAARRSLPGPCRARPRREHRSGAGPARRWTRGT